MSLPLQSNITSSLTITISILTLIILLFIFIPKQWLNALGKYNSLNNLKFSSMMKSIKTFINTIIFAHCILYINDPHYLRKLFICLYTAKILIHLVLLYLFGLDLDFDIIPHVTDKELGEINSLEDRCDYFKEQYIKANNNHSEFCTGYWTW